MPSLQGQQIVATKAVCHKINHLLRNIPGGELDLFGPLSVAYDAAVLCVPTRATGRTFLPERSRRIAQLPCSEGGLGYRTWQSTADPAYLSAYVHASCVFPTLFPEYAHLFPDVRSLNTASGGVLPEAPSKAAYFASRALARLVAKAPGVLEAVAPSTGVTPRQLQHAISLQTDCADKLAILQCISAEGSPSHPRHMAAYYSSAGDSITFATTPVDTLTTISNADFKTIINLKLLLPFTTFEDAPKQCPSCHKLSTEVISGTSPSAYVVDRFGDHTSSCSRVSGSHRTTEWHDRLVRAWFFIIRSTGVRCGTEVNGLVVGSGERPGVVVYPGAGSEEIWLDVRTCTPASSSTNCKRAASFPGHAARLGVVAKDAAWVDLAIA